LAADEDADGHDEEITIAGRIANAALRLAGARMVAGASNKVEKSCLRERADVEYARRMERSEKTNEALECAGCILLL
jgi:hypothetical protein